MFLSAEIALGPPVFPCEIPCRSKPNVRSPQTAVQHVTAVLLLLLSTGVIPDSRGINASTESLFDWTPEFNIDSKGLVVNRVWLMCAEERESTNMKSNPRFILYSVLSPWPLISSQIAKIYLLLVMK